MRDGPQADASGRSELPGPKPGLYRVAQELI